MTAVTGNVTANDAGIARRLPMSPASCRIVTSAASFATIETDRPDRA